MDHTTVLLVSGDASLIEPVSRAIALIRGCCVEAYPTVAAALPQLNRDDVGSFVVHLDCQGEGALLPEWPEGCLAQPTRIPCNDEPGVVRLLQEIAGMKRAVAVVVLSEQHQPEQALRLLRLGAADYLSRPLDLGRLTFLIDTLTIRARYARESRQDCPNPPAVQSVGERDPFLCVTPEMKRIVEQVRRLAPQDTVILFTGKTGTGKTRLARLVHELSPRRDEPFAVVNCGALSASLIESELFGHVKGAFTGAERDRTGRLAEVAAGTLLLDDLDTLPLSAQAKLLQAVDERVFQPVGCNRQVPLRCRLIGATSRSLDEEVKAGRFRADLYYRINVVSLHLPPLRSQCAVIPALAEKFLADFAARNQRNIPRLSADVLRVLQAYDWPGNVRELRNIIERAAALCRGDQIGTDDLPDALYATQADPPCTCPPVESSASLAETKTGAEVVRILDALIKQNGNRVRAATELGISRSALYKKLHKHSMI